MIRLKKKEEIEIMKEAGSRLRRVINYLVPFVRAGMTTKEVDREAERLIKFYGGKPGFKKVPNYHWSTCITINEQIVHTQPSGRVIKKGDLLTIDLGLIYQGYNSDYSTTFVVDKKDSFLDKFIETGRRALNKAIKVTRKGNRIGDVSKAIEDEIEGNGYFVIRDLTGHGIGKKLHEDPLVFGFLERPIKKTPLIEVGLVVAIEVIYSQGTRNIAYEKGKDWSIVTSDGSLGACIEKTVAVTENGPIILT